MLSEKEIYESKYLLQTVLKNYPVKDLKIQNQTHYRIDCKVFDDAYDVIYFLVDKSDVILNKDDTCDIVLTQKEYNVHYYYKDESVEMICLNIHRFIITDAYYAAYPERYVFSFDLLCVSEGSVSELDSTFLLRLLSSNVVLGSFIHYQIPKKALYWVNNKNVDKQYAHVELRYPEYDVVYKNKSTRWKDKKIQVRKEDLIRDFVNSKRAAYTGISPKMYVEYLLQEYEFSHLFELKTGAQSPSSTK